MVLVYGLAGFGAVVAAILAVFAAFAGLAWFNDEWGYAEKNGFNQGVEARNRALQSDSWWFSEDMHTTNLLQDLSSGMPVASARTRWREARGDSGATQACPGGSKRDSEGVREDHPPEAGKMVLPADSLARTVRE